MTIVNFILGLLGTIMGGIGTWLSIEARRQHLKITDSQKRKHGYKITNHTLRPIPIESLTLLVKKQGGVYTPAGAMEIDGLSIPGILAPESSFEVYWSNIEQTVDAVWSDEYRIELRTQTGKTIRSKTNRK